MPTHQDVRQLQERFAVSGQDVPILDLGLYLAGEPGAAQATAAELRRGLEEVGFFMIVNHGVPKQLRDRMVEQTARFYKLPLEKKLPLKINTHGIGYVPNRGQFPKTSPYYTGTKKPDVCEAMLLYRDWGADFAHRKNPWPDDMPEFRTAIMDYYTATEDLGIRMLPLYALALDLDPDFFNDKFPKDQSINILRVSYMPPEPLDDDEFNVAPHTDGSFMTLLATSDQPGLEILSQSGQWIKMPLIPNAFVVNAGDLLTHWSNGRVLSTPHRVINRSGVDRYSIPLFMQPAADAIIDCLPTCQGPDNPPKQPPIACADYLQWFMEENFALGDKTYEMSE